MKYYGAAYYPEQETTEDIEKDIALMKDGGFNAVRIGEFAWTRFEPKEGKYDFSWCDHVVDRLGSNGIHSIVCTPTACPPIWMVERHPDILYKDSRGVVRPFGGRRHYCYNNPVYREYSRKIASEIGKRYGNSQYVLGFHVDNELAQEGSGRCQCDVCKAKFRNWLTGRYETIENFNEKAGTIFWSMQYERFDQINPPLKSIEPSGPQVHESFVDNPTLRLDWERFCSDSLIEYLDLQTEAVRSSGKKPVTTNATGFWTNAINYYEAFAKLDVAAGDVYPSLRTDNMLGATLDYAFHRGFKGKNFWVVETSSAGGQGVWAQQGVLQPFPGALRQNLIQALACGADVFLYFQWRTFRYGAEQLEGSVMDIDGIPRRRFKEYQEAAKDMRRLTEILEQSHIQNEAAIVFDYDSFWALKIKPIHRGYSYQNQIYQTMAALSQSGIAADVIGMADDFKKYKMIVLMTPVVMSAELQSQLKAYVRNGGTVVTNFLTSIKNPYNTAPRQPVPGGLTDLFGARVGEGEISVAESETEVAFNISGQTITGKTVTWSETLELLGAEPIAHFRSTFRQGDVVASRNRFGKGLAYYLGTWLADEPLSQLFSGIGKEAGLSRVPFRFGPGVEVITRLRNGKPVYFMFNYRQGGSFVEFEHAFRDVLSGQTLQGTVNMTAKQYFVLE